MTYLPHAIISQLTTTYLATTPASTHPFGLSSLRIATYGQLFGWISQFLGHGFAEGRAPALLDSLLQGLFFPDLVQLSCLGLADIVFLAPAYTSGRPRAVLQPPGVPLLGIQLQVPSLCPFLKVRTI
jgi:hypothetical protein